MMSNDYHSVTEKWQYWWLQLDDIVGYLLSLRERIAHVCQVSNLLRNVEIDQ